MRANLIDAAARRWSLRAALFLGLIAMIAALATSVDAQGQPKTPHWFWGTDADAYAGSTIQAVDQNGTVVETATIDSDGGWSVVVSPEDASQVKLRILSASGDRETALMDVIVGGFDPDGLSIAEFQAVDSGDDLDDLQGDAETLTVRIIARRAPDGRVEFGMRPPVGDDIFPRARYFPATGPDHNRWLRSSEIDFGDGFVGRIIARRAPDGRVEFGFRVAGYDDLFPRARYFPATGPDHNRWLRSSEIEIGRPQ